MKRHLATLALLSSTACSEPPQPAPVGKPVAPATAKAGESKTADDGKAAPPAPAVVEMQEVAPGVEIPKKLPNGIPLMTPMDFALCMIPAAELTTADERRRRGWARRKLIMNNPDSPTARALTDLAEAAQSGELAPPSFEQAGGKPTAKDSGVVFSLPGTKPQGGRPPAGYRPPAGSDASSDASSEAKSEAKSEDAPQ